MADNVGIIRVPTSEEKQDYSQLGLMTPQTKFLKELSKVSQGFVKEHKPFDSQCAKLDFADELEKIERESEREFGYIREGDVRKLKFENLEKYGDLKRFTLEEDDEEVEMQNVNNTKTAVVIGHTMKYVCRGRNHGCSVFVPMELWNERFGKKKSKVVEEK